MRMWTAVRRNLSKWLSCNALQVPYWQNRIVQGCRKRGKPVIVATNMLESMIANPTPTRAEVLPDLWLEYRLYYAFPAQRA